MRGGINKVRGHGEHAFVISWHKSNKGGSNPWLICVYRHNAFRFFSQCQLHSTSIAVACEVPLIGLYVPVIYYVCVPATTDAT